jgi:putative selenate reductase
MPSLPELHRRRGQLAEAAVQPLADVHCSSETERCLACDLLCNRCVDVCPNRANIALDLEEEALFSDRFQILHLEGLCNECGNCVTFCPHDGAPWKEKVTLFSSAAAFDASTTSGFLMMNKGANGRRDYRIRLNEMMGELSLHQDGAPAETEATTALVSSAQGRQLLHMLQLLHTEYDYLFPAV